MDFVRRSSPYAHGLHFPELTVGPLLQTALVNRRRLSRASALISMSMPYLSCDPTTPHDALQSAVRELQSPKRHAMPYPGGGLITCYCWGHCASAPPSSSSSSSQASPPWPSFAPKSAIYAASYATSSTSSVTIGLGGPGSSSFSLEKA